MSAGPGTLRRSLLAGWLVALVMIAAACSDEEKPGTLPKSTTPAPSSASPSPSATTPEQQVEATLRDYFEVANAAFESGNTSELEAFTKAECPCRKIATDIKRVHAQGGRYEGARYDVKAMKVHDVIGATAAIEVRANVPPYKVINAQGDATEDSAGGTLHTDFSLVRQENGQWLITNSFDLG